MEAAITATAPHKCSAASAPLVSPPIWPVVAAPRDVESDEVDTDDTLPVAVTVGCAEVVLVCVVSLVAVGDAVGASEGADGGDVATYGHRFST